MFSVKSYQSIKPLTTDTVQVEMEVEEEKPQILIKEKKESKKHKSWGQRSTRTKRPISYRFVFTLRQSDTHFLKKKKTNVHEGLLLQGALVFYLSKFLLEFSFACFFLN